MTKPYTWEEIKLFLEKELKKTKHIQTYGTFGSCNIEHDIDTLISKKPFSKTSDFYKEVHTLFDLLNEYLKSKYYCKLIRTSRFICEEEIKYIANYEQNDLVFQVYCYVSYSQIKKHWYAAFSGNFEKMNLFLKSDYNLILGTVDSLFEKDFEEKEADHLFMHLTDSDRINSNFPVDFLINKMNVFYDYILRKRIGSKLFQARTIGEVREGFYFVCDELDELENKRKNLN